jgi:hypothetical protein
MIALILSVEGGEYHRAITPVYLWSFPKDRFQLSDMSDYGLCSFEIVLTNNNSGHSVAMKITAAEYLFFDANVGGIIYPRTQEGYHSMERALKIIFEQKYTGYPNMGIHNFVCIR